MTNVEIIKLILLILILVIVAIDLIFTFFIHKKALESHDTLDSLVILKRKHVDATINQHAILRAIDEKLNKLLETKK